jgi:hypothetical protein
MESSGPLPGLPFRKKPRIGQERAIALLPGRRQLNIKLPTGYGKTYLNAMIFAILRAAGLVNRLLVIFPSNQQLEQFVRDAPYDLRNACVDGPLAVIDIRYFGTEALKKHRQNKAQVFVTTIQSLMGREGMSALGDLMSVGRWMVTVDEYHHYGQEKAWGLAVRALHHEFLLAMSATPYRPYGDSAFGAPDVTVTYRDAVEERAAKPLRGHAYHYRIETIDEEGNILTYTTAELVKEAGGDSPEAIEKLLIKRKMRWSPKYISPMLSKPIERMLRERLSVPGGFLQALAGCMCVSHAKVACEQARAMFPELRIDWAGTGKDGRSDAENKEVLDKFCPPKGGEAQCQPTLDVLFHANLAGEGLNCIPVSEVIHLNAAEVNNSNNQENGRASRYIVGVVGNINFDASSGYAEKKYVGKNIELAMDELPADAKEPEPPDGDLDDLPDLPDEPAIQIYDMELEGIDSGDPEVKLYERSIISAGLTPFTEADMNDPDPSNAFHAAALNAYKTMRRQEASEFNEKSIVEQWRAAVGTALASVTGRAIRLLFGNKRVDGKVAGQIKYRINGRKKRDCGELCPDVEVCRRHYKWLAALDRAMREAKKAPEWLQNL